MGKKKGSKKPSPTGKKVVKPLHAEQSTAQPQTEETRPPVVPSTSSIQTSTAGTPQTPYVPLDAVLKLLESLSPGLNLTNTLARLAAENTNPVLVQLPITHTPQPTTAPPSQLSPKPKSPTPEQFSELPTPTEIPTKIPTETFNEDPVNTQTQAANILEDVDTTGANLTPGSVGESGGTEEEMEVEVVVEAGDERKEEEKGLENEVVVEKEELKAAKERELKSEAGRNLNLLKEKKRTLGKVKEVVLRVKGVV